MGESDISATIKGKGYFATPETVDRKALKLARKRILFNYTVRDESQEALYGKIKCNKIKSKIEKRNQNKTISRWRPTREGIDFPVK